MKKSLLVLITAAIILGSGAVGFGGAALAYGAKEAGLLKNLVGYMIDVTGYEFAAAIPEEAEAIPLSEFAFAETDPYEDYELTEEPSGVVQLSALPPQQDVRTPLTIPQIAKNVANSVVEIETERVVNSSWFQQYRTSGAGSGVIISADGYIITCNHVIDGASKILVRLRDGREFEAALVGRDVRTDLAVIKIKTAGLHPAVFGNSDKLEVGELAVAVGNPLGELGGSVTEGIISALNRDINIEGEIMNLLQTSAAVNPGNSGGALFNAYGELIGVVNAKSGGTQGGTTIEGIGFAIPSGTAKAIAENLIEHGYVLGRVDFGILMLDIHDNRTAMRNGVNAFGVYVRRSDDESGLRAGDRIVSVNGINVSYSAEVKKIYEQYGVGDVLNIVIARDGQNYKTELILKQMKD